jgi:hypothetical protein
MLGSTIEPCQCDDFANWLDTVPANPSGASIKSLDAGQDLGGGDICGVDVPSRIGPCGNG